jgi:POT family proton-dependent oligopeptide transporter
MHETITKTQNQSDELAHSWLAKHPPHQNQPHALYYICATNLWERFGYYTSRAILVLYMVKSLLFSHEKAYAIFAAFTALLYLAPLLGGHLGDTLLNPKRGVILGGIMLSAGYFLLAIPGTQYFYTALAVVIIGNGFFMPNISSVLGNIYKENDPRREGGFSILYSAINLGSLVPPLISASIISLFGWHIAFLTAGVGTLLSSIIFYFFIYRHSLPAKIKKINYLFMITGFTIAIYFIGFSVKNTQITNIILFLCSSSLVLYTLKNSFKYIGQTRNRLLACLLLTLFSILFCVLYEQAAMSLTIYTEYNVDRNWHNWIIPTVTFLALNPFFIITCGPLASKLWVWLDKRKLNPSIPAKFALGTILIGFGFAVLPLGILIQSSLGQINLWWIVLSYFLQSIGELLVYPVGLSMMTELAPKQMIGLMIGVWYFATAISNALAGVVSISTVATSESTIPIVTSSTYSFVFGVLGWLAIIAGLILFCFIKPIKELIK